MTKEIPIYVVQEFLRKEFGEEDRFEFRNRLTKKVKNGKKCKNLFEYSLTWDSNFDLKDLTEEQRKLLEMNIFHLLAQINLVQVFGSSRNSMMFIMLPDGDGVDVDKNKNTLTVSIANPTPGRNGAKNELHERP